MNEDLRAVLFMRLRCENEEKLRFYDDFICLKELKECALINHVNYTHKNNYIEFTREQIEYLLNWG